MARVCVAGLLFARTPTGIIIINRLFMAPHLWRAHSAYKDIRIRSFYHTDARTHVHTHTHTQTHAHTHTCITVKHTNISCHYGYSLEAEATRQQTDIRTNFKVAKSGFFLKQTVQQLFSWHLLLVFFCVLFSFKSILDHISGSYKFL